MRKTWAALIALIVLATLVTAGPVAAKKPLEGTMDLDFNLGFLDETTECPEVTWAGNIDFDGEIHGMAFIPTALPVVVGQAFHFEDLWMIYEGPFTYSGGVFTECDDPIVMWGYDAGVENLTTLHAVAHGNVEWVDADGPFDVSLTGGNVRWRGVVADTEIEFVGTWRVN